MRVTDSNGQQYTIEPEANLKGADLEEANLAGANLTWANLTNATMLNKARFTNIKYDQKTIFPPHFTPPPSR